MQSTQIQTKDGQAFTLCHQEDLTPDELDLFQSLTGAEFRFFLLLCDFYILPLDES